MGKVAGAALKVAAPEAAAAGAVAGKVGGKARKPPVPDPRVTHPGSEAARQRQAVEDVKAARKPEPQPDGDEPEDQGDEPEQRGPGLVEGMTPGGTGSGILLGVIVWAGVRAWIGGPGRPSGAEGLKALLRAKFLNKPLPKSGG